MGGVWTFRVPEQGQYLCSLFNFAPFGNHEGTYYFSGLSGIPQLRSKQALILDSTIATRAKFPTSTGHVATIYFGGNDDNVYTGDLTSNTLTIGGRPFKVVVVDNEVPINPSWFRPCTDESGNSAPNMTFAKESGVWVFRVPEQGAYSCRLENSVYPGYDKQTYQFTGLPTRDQSIGILAVSPGLNDDALITYGQVFSADDTIYTGDRKSGILAIGDQKFQMILIDDETPSANGPSFASACNNKKTGVTTDPVTLSRTGNTWSFTIPEEGQYECVINNLPLSDTHPFRFNRLNKYKSRLTLSQGTQTGTAKLTVGDIDSTSITGDIDSDVLTIGNLKFKATVLDADVAAPTFTGGGTTCASSNSAAAMTLTQENGVWVFTVAEEGQYNCTLINVVELNGYQGTYHFAGLSGIPENTNNQSFVLGTAVGLEEVHRGTLKFGTPTSNDDNTYTGNRESDVAHHRPAKVQAGGGGRRFQGTRSQFYQWQLQIRSGLHSAGHDSHRGKRGVGVPGAGAGALQL